MATAPRLTREERRAHERQAQTAARVRDFKERIERARSLRLYSDRDAWAEDGASGVLRDLVRQLRDATRELTGRIENLQTDLGRVAAFVVRRGLPYSSPVVGGRGTDIDMLVARRAVLHETATRLAHATGWHVPELLTEEEEKRVAVRRSLSVREEWSACKAVGCGTVWHAVDDCAYPQQLGARKVWRVYIGDVRAMPADFGFVTADQRPVDYETETSAWVAAALLVGETLQEG